MSNRTEKEMLDSIDILNIELDRAEEFAHDDLDAGLFESASRMCKKCIDLNIQIDEVHEELMRDL